MFTPPPSPIPAHFGSFHGTDSSVSSSSPPSSPQQFLTPGLVLASPPLKKGAHRGRQQESLPFIQDRKRRIAWRTGSMVIIVPLILVLVTLLMRFPSPPLFSRLLAGSSPGIRGHVATGMDGTVHPVHAHHRRQTGASAITPGASSSPNGSNLIFPTMTSTSASGPSQTVPTVPMSPVLPTPFPQAFDTTLSNNFTTNSCTTFFTNMTESLAFRECRAFSFLSQTSSAFLQAQSNLTALNIDVWGTCNTPMTADQCTANMEWFLSQLLDACSKEKSDDDATVLRALSSLQSFSLMRNVGCLVNQDTSTYCYIEAAGRSNPSDLYFYTLPFGLLLPNNSTPSCSSCTKNLMGLYGSQANVTDGLQRTYNAAARLASSKCGSSYVSAIASSSASHWFGDTPPSGWTFVFTLGVLLMGLVL